MDDHDFERSHAELLERLRRERGSCPTVEELTDLNEAEQGRGSLDAAACQRLHAHLALCPRCAREWELLAGLETAEARLDDERWRAAEHRLSARRAPWRGRARSRPRRARWLAAAAALLALLAAGWWWTQRAGAPVSEVRGGILLTAPTGRVDAVPRFTWSSAAPVPLVYQLEVDLGAGDPYRLLTTGDSFEPPPSLGRELGPGTRFRWRVVAFAAGDAGGAERVFAESPWVEVTVGEE